MNHPPTTELPARTSKLSLFKKRAFCDGLKNALSFASSIIVLHCCAAKLLASEPSAQLHISKQDKRTIQFPKVSIGRLQLVENGSSFTDFKGTPVGPAVGRVTVTVPSGSHLVMDANAQVFKNPSLLDEVSPYGIDSLKIAFVSLSDEEENACDKAISHVQHFKSLKNFCADGSDITDKGLSLLKNVSSIKCISCSLSPVRGFCFKQLALLPELAELNCSMCQIDEKALPDLSLMRHLRFLDLKKTKLGLPGARVLAQCTGLVALRLRGNSNFDDKCLQYLQPLKHLQYLDLSETKVTPRGLLTLTLPNLKLLLVPKTGELDVRQLKKHFRGTDVKVDLNPGPTEEEKTLWAPLR